jgi:hypothetical protein
MDVAHERVAGLDLRKEAIVVCVMAGRKATAECRTFDATTCGLGDLTWLTKSGPPTYRRK